MSQTDGYRVDPVAYHHLLLRCAGRLPDELTSAARLWLARGHGTEVAEAIGYAAVSGRLTLSASDLALLNGTLKEAGLDIVELAGMTGSAGVSRAGIEDDPMSRYGMAPLAPSLLAGYPGEPPYCLDLTADGHHPDSIDAVDAAAMAAVAEVPCAAVPAVGLWRTWRYPARRTPWPTPKRLYLVQLDTTDETRLPVCAEAIQQALRAADEPHPQVEVFADAARLPAYQRAALAFGALLWTARPARPVRIARLYDTTDRDGEPGFAPDHPLLAGQERDAVLGYLAAGTPLLASTAVLDDVTRAHPGPVPVTFRTDGAWVWTDAVGYYLAQHGLCPDPDLLGHIRERAYSPLPVGRIGVHRALSALCRPAPEPAVA
jgi:hypothetical protein